MWYEESVFYQIYPLGFCGAPYENDGLEAHRILKVLDWIPHLTKLGINAVYFSPVFRSDTHGYNTQDYTVIDNRLGSNEDFKKVVDALHEAGIRVVLDGVFNHVGRGFWAFRDVLEKKWDSPYKDWFHISFDGNSNYNDGFWYEGWEGNYDLVKLNLRNNDVVEHIFSAVRGWVNGELLHGDYAQFVNPDMLDSCTNYACYKGLYSSFNSMNMFEIIHSLQQQFGPEQWCRYRGMHLMSFVDNHDVTRVASILENPAHLPLIYTLAFGMPGFPQIYYGSEWGAKATKQEGDPALRACFEKPEWNELTDHIAKLTEIKKNSKALNYGTFRSVLLTNKQCIFERKTEDERVLIAINADSEPFTAHFDAGCGQAEELLTGSIHDFGGGSELAPYSSEVWRMER